MVSGIDRLRRAGELLRKDGTDSKALTDAGLEAWSAMADLADWPTELRMQAVELQGDLFRYGSIRMTVGQMTEPELSRLRRDLVRFVEFAERVKGSAVQAGSGTDISPTSV